MWLPRMMPPPKPCTASVSSRLSNVLCWITTSGENVRMQYGDEQCRNVESMTVTPGGRGEVHDHTRAAGAAVEVQRPERDRARGRDADHRPHRRGRHRQARDDDALGAGDRHARDAGAGLAREREVGAARDRDGSVGRRPQLDRVAGLRRDQRRGQLGVARHAHGRGRGRRRCERGRGEQQPGEQEAPHQSVPYMRSPASPRPGTM